MSGGADLGAGTRATRVSREWQMQRRSRQKAPLVIADYDPAWPGRYARERDLVAAALGALAVGIEHIGSTSIPGLGAKRVIDVLVGLRRMQAVDESLQRLARVGYEYVDTYDEGRRVSLAKGDARSLHEHLHLVAHGSPQWEDPLLFRDFLRAHPDVAAAYGDVKRELARRIRAEGGDYVEAKGPFIRSVLARARAERVDE